jgi:hypothetical protein
MYPKLEQNTKKLESASSPSDVEDFTKLVEGIKEYVADVEKLNLEVNYLLEEKEECFEEFDNDIPDQIKKEREVRRKAKNLILAPGKSRLGHNSDAQSRGASSQHGDNTKPNDMYYMLKVNCQYRKRIHEMLKNLRELNKKRRELEDKWGPFKRELNKVKEVKVYKAVKGDAIDELFAFHLNKHQLNLPIKRLGPGKYLFGTKQILAKIINGKLVIRVGGGYMSADEFIEQYGPMEILKIQQQEERNDPDYDASKKGPTARMSIRMTSPKGSPKVGMGDMKAAMKDQLNNMKVYGDDPQLNTRMSMKEAEAHGISAAQIGRGSPRRGQGSPKASRASMRSPKNNS